MAGPGRLRSRASARGPRARLARRVRWRRGAAAVLAAVAAWVGVGAAVASRPHDGGRPVVVAARDLPAGAVLAEADVTVVRVEDAQVPAGTARRVADVVGRAVAGPVLAHETLSPARLVGASLLAAQPADHVAMTVPVLDAAQAGARAGERVDVYATGSGARVATDVVVLAVREPRADGPLGAANPPQVTLSLGSTDAAGVARTLGGLDAGQSFVLAIRQRAGVAQ